MIAMAKKKSQDKVELVKETDFLLVFKANKPLRESEFKLLSDLVRHEEEKAGVKVVLLPHSADLVNIKFTADDDGKKKTTDEKEKGNKEEPTSDDK
jgi:hypothetical protein